MARTYDVPPVVEPVLRPRPRPREGCSYHFFRWMRWTAVLTVMLVLGIVGLNQWRAVEVAKHEADLKRDMIQRGLNAQDIEMVLRARPNGERSRGRTSLSAAELARHQAVEEKLIQDLTVLDRKAEDIERIVTAFSTHLGSGSGRNARQAAEDAEFVFRLASDGKSVSEVEQIIRLKARGRVDTTQTAAVRPVQRDRRQDVEDALKTLLKSGWTAEELHDLMKQMGPQ